MKNKLFRLSLGLGIFVLMFSSKTMAVVYLEDGANSNDANRMVLSGGTAPVDSKVSCLSHADVFNCDRGLRVISLYKVSDGFGREDCNGSMNKGFYATIPEPENHTLVTGIVLLLLVPFLRVQRESGNSMRG